MKRPTRPLALSAALALSGMTMHAAEAQQRLSGEQLIRALQDGGFVLVMSEAESAVPSAAAGSRGGFGGFGGGRGGRGGGGGRGGAPDGAPGAGAERPPELTTESQNMMVGMRHSIWHFKIPIDHVYSAPDRAATQQAEEVPFADIAEVDGLSEGAANEGWLAAKVREMPMAKSNSIIVTHAANIAKDLGIDSVAPGETVVVRPGEHPMVVGEIGLKEWSVLAVDLEP